MNFRPNPLLYGAHEDFLSSFKLVISMRDNVEHDLLLKAVNSAMKRYPYFCVSPQKNGDTIQLQFNESPVPVFEDSRCAVLGTKESNGHLLAFGCEDRRIFLHVSHYIADGMGICPLMLTVLYLYISEKYGTDGLNCSRILMPDDSVSEEEYAYPFPEEPVLINVSETQKKSPMKVYSLDPDAFDKEGLYAYHLRIPQISMMSVANPSDGSPVSFLSTMLFRAICELDKEIDSSVVAHVQHQYRASINAPFNRHSLVNYIPVELPPLIKDRSVELQNTIVRGQIIMESEPERDWDSINRLVSVFPKEKHLSLAEKQLAMRQYIEKSIGGKTFGISYVGKMNWCGLDRYIEDLHAYIGEKSTQNMLLIEVMTVGEDFSVNFMQSGCGARYVNAFMEQLKEFNIPVSLVGEERYSLCNTKIPH
ncbi:MAG: hypothetical protein IKV97_05430 [Clostridia bacterium]|nr:hypothetical protein [Clostridia bacterium]